MDKTQNDYLYEENFYRQELVDLQAIIRAQDFKIGYLFVVCFLPISQIINLKVFFNDFTHFSVKLILVLIILFWIISVLFLIIATYPRFSKKIYYEIKTKEQRLAVQKEDVNAVFNICKSKIIFIRMSLLFIVFWSVLIIASVIASL